MSNYVTKHLPLSFYIIGSVLLYKKAVGVFVFEKGILLKLK